MANIKRRVRGLIANDDIEKSIALLLRATETETLEDINQEIILQSANYEAYKKQSRTGTIAEAELNRIRNTITVTLLNILQDLPDMEVTQEMLADDNKDPTAKLSGISERNFKKHIFIMMLGVKIIVVIFLFTLWESGGFTIEQFLGTCGLLIPVFTTYSTLMFKDIIQQRHVEQNGYERQVSRNFQWMTYFLLITYLVVLLVVIGLRPQGVIDFKQLNTMLILVESALGVYVGQIVYALFKKTDSM